MWQQDKNKLWQLLNFAERYFRECFRGNAYVIAFSENFDIYKIKSESVSYMRDIFLLLMMEI